LVRSQGVLGFIPAVLVRAVRYDVVVTPYPGTDLGMTLFAGRVIPVLKLGDDRALIVCDIDGETIGVLGLEPLQSGLLEGDDQAARYEGASVAHLDLREQLGRWRAHRRSQEEPWLI
jgi:hypothetical protein